MNIKSLSPANKQDQTNDPQFISSGQNLLTAPFSGQYQVKGNKWTGIDNEFVILVCYRRPEHVTPSKPETFLRDQTHSRYLSSVYGSEFEVDGIRYRIDRIGDGKIEIVALRSVKKRNGWRSK